MPSCAACTCSPQISPPRSTPQWPLRHSIGRSPARSAPNTRESRDGMRRSGPASGCSHASRPSSSRRLASDGGHSGPNEPGRVAVSAGGVARPRRRGCSDGGPSCGEMHAAKSEVTTTRRLRLRRRARHRVAASARCLSRKHSSEQSVCTDEPTACTKWRGSKSPPHQEHDPRTSVVSMELASIIALPRAFLSATNSSDGSPSKLARVAAAASATSLTAVVLHARQLTLATSGKSARAACYDDRGTSLRDVIE